MSLSRGDHSVLRRMDSRWGNEVDKRSKAGLKNPFPKHFEMTEREHKEYVEQRHGQPIKTFRGSKFKIKEE